ncbi:carbonic anhydrase [Aspergillus californicus]
MKAGDVFVHRNIANILHPTDLNSAAVIEYAIGHLCVKHVIVCGHTNCGGVAAVVDKKQLGIIDAWLWPLRQLHQDHLEALQCMPDEKIALVELNVLAGVKTLKQKSVVLEAMQKGLEVHGLVYDVGTGILRELDTTGCD